MIQPGTKVAHYEIVSALGKGGMGEVWRARDTTLGREVAIKTLPGAFAEDTDRVARFEREAKLLASLNHPNIAAIYGLEEHEGSRFLVLELVEGYTLADRIAQGVIQVDESLEMALQIAEALEAAHEKGVIHRDLKPANIKVTPEGRVKVLDFGLAKVLAGDQPDVNVSSSPTLSMEATRAGIILGTAAYMSPEQARGHEVDRRTDVWAFGCVLFEMLTGRKAFDGAEVSDVLAYILTQEPEFNELPLETPGALGRVLRRCLRKDRRHRLHDVADVRLEIEAALDEPALDESGGRGAERVAWAPSRTVAGLIVAFLLGMGASFGWLAGRSSLSVIENMTVAPKTVTVVDLPDEAPLALGTTVPLHGFDSPAVAVSPDGAWLAYVGQFPSGTMVYLREMATGDIAPVEGSEDAIHAFFSPDSRWVGFLTDRQVKKASIDVRDVEVLADAGGLVQAWWDQSDIIYFSHNQGLLLSRVPAESVGRQSPVIGQRVTELLDTQAMARYSEVLPGGRAVLATRWTRSVSGDYAEVVIIDPDTMAWEPLIPNAYGARYIAPGHLALRAWR